MTASVTKRRHLFKGMPALIENANSRQTSAQKRPPLQKHAGSKSSAITIEIASACSNYSFCSKNHQIDHDIDDKV